MAVSDSAEAFLQVFNEQTLEQLVADFEQIKVADPSAVMPTFSADLSGANPLQAGLLYQLSELSHELAVPLGGINVTLGTLSDESLQGLSVAEAAAVMGATNPPPINKISVVDTANGLLDNQSLFTTLMGCLLGFHRTVSARKM